MYSRQEAAQLRQEFWTAFGQYMLPIPSTEGGKVNWINYKTGEKDIFFRMQADQQKAVISIELAHQDEALRRRCFEELARFKERLRDAVGEDWQWAAVRRDDQGKMVAMAYAELPGVSILNKQDWPALISFFKPRILALDAFWGEVRYAFELLR